MQRRVGVLLRVEHPDQQVDQLDQPVDLQPVLPPGPSRSPAGRAAPARRPRTPAGRPAACRRGTSSQSSSGPAESAPQTTAVAADGGRPAYPDLADRLPGQRVDQRGLAAAGGSGDRDHGVRGAQPQPRTGLAGDPGGLVDQRRVEPAAAEHDDLVERRQPVGQRGATRRHAATRTASAPAAGRPGGSGGGGGVAGRLTAAEARRASSSSCAAARSPSAAAGSGAPASTSARNRSASPAEQLLHPLHQVVPGLGGHGPDHAVAEDRLQHLLGHRRRAAGDEHLGPGEPAGLGEDEQHDREAGTVHAERRHPRRRTALGALRGHQGRARRPARPGPRSRSRSAKSSDERASTVRDAPSRAAPPGRPRQASAVRSAARSAAARTSDSTLDSTASATSWSGSGRPVSAEATRSRIRPDPGLQPAQQLAGADELLPAGQHLAAQHGPAAHAVVDVPDRGRVQHVGVLEQDRGGRARLVRGPGQRRDPLGHAAQRAVQGRPDHLGPGGGVRGQPEQPVASAAPPPAPG